ncbi:hypothetical protein PENSPDRAFT_653679 [Peniophora sp. CONT]|nr:hypothetical protein PENSPDRAFT_654225 [Peniophora sp. CONT]KZV67949.1 hypothetical protein PENSPDRAFT_653679 [Peniophora sp. CONT]
MSDKPTKRNILVDPPKGDHVMVVVIHYSQEVDLRIFHGREDKDASRVSWRASGKRRRPSSPILVDDESESSSESRAIKRPRFRPYQPAASTSTVAPPSTAVPRTIDLTDRLNEALAARAKKSGPF